MSVVLSTIVTGVGATAVMDLWSIVRKVLMGVAPPNYSLVGRWIAGMGRGRFRHDSIAASPAVQHERAIGWVAHYLIGIAFAALLVMIRGDAWIKEPTFAPALIVGLGTVTAPFLLMQPGMGAGIAASRTRDPAAARLQSVVTHGVFGVGLYLAGCLARGLLAVQG